MEGWQTEFISRNLTTLVENTTVYPQLLLRLQSEGVLDGDGWNEIESKRGLIARSKCMYEVVQSYRNGFFALVKALRECEQIPAMNILLQGVFYYGLPNMKVKLGGKVLALTEILADNHIRELDETFKIFLEDDYVKAVLNSQKNESALPLVRDTIPPSLPFYIPRSMSRRSRVDPKIFKESCTDFFVLSGIDRAKLTEIAGSNLTSTSSKQLREINCRFIHLECKADFEVIRKKAKAPVHLIEYDKDCESFILMETSGGSTCIRQYLRYADERQGEPFISEQELINICKTSSVSGVCICDTPGMGKSVLLAHLAKKVQTDDSIVGFIQLSTFLKTLCRPLVNPHEFAAAWDLLTSHLTSSFIGQEILKKAITQSSINAVLFLDAFDEILSQDCQWAMDWIQTLVKGKSNIKLVVSSRPHMRGTLEIALGVIAYDIKPFTEICQETFLTTYWKNKFHTFCESKLLQFAKYSLGYLNKTLKQDEKDIMGIPLQCYILAEVTMEDAKIFSDPQRNSNLNNMCLPAISSVYEMYRSFTDMSFKGKKELEGAPAINHQPSYVRQIKIYHTWKALQLLFPEVEEVFSQYFQLHDSDIADLFAYGIIEEKTIGQGKTMKAFIHRSIAEFLTAEFFVQALTNQSYQDWKSTKFYSKVVTSLAQTVFATTKGYDEPLSLITYIHETVFNFVFRSVFTLKNAVIVYFVDGHLNRQITTHKFAADKLMASLSPEMIFRLLSCCASLGYNNIFQVMEILLKSTNPKILNQYQTYLTDTDEGSNFPRSFLLLLDAVRSSELKTVQQCFRFYDTCFNANISCDCTNERLTPIVTPLYKAVAMGQYEIVEFLLSKATLDDPSVLRACVRDTYGTPREVLNNRINILKLLHRKNPRLFQEPNRGCKGILVTEKVDLKIFKYLAQQGADINALNTDENSAFGYDKRNVVHMANSYMTPNDFEELCRFLLIECREVNLFRKHTPYWKTPLHAILNRKNNLQTVRMILEIPDFDYNDNDSNDRSEDNFIFNAIRGGQNVEIMQLLVALGVNLDYKNMYGDTAMHLAVKYARLEIVIYFITIGFPLLNTDSCGQTPLQLAEIKLYECSLAFSTSDLSSSVEFLAEISLRQEVKRVLMEAETRLLDP